MTIRHRYPLRLLRVPTGLLVAGMLAACTSSHLLVGQARGSISPDQVQVYLRPPARFEEIALVESSSRASFAITAQARMDKVIERLKKEAALLGANGIVIQNVADQSSGWSSKTYQIAIKPQLGPRVVEEYSLSPDGKQLTVKATIGPFELSKVELTRVYDATGEAIPNSAPSID